MSDPRESSGTTAETGGHLLAPSSTTAHPLHQANNPSSPSPTQALTSSSSATPAHNTKRRKSSLSSHERVAGTQSRFSSSAATRAGRRQPGPGKGASFVASGPSRGESSMMQRSMSPVNMGTSHSPETSINYTRTGRISKAKKGLKVHHCECGRSYTRAEHLRRHQKNHAPEPFLCNFPECGKPFFRLDLLQRHQERHSDPGRTEILSPGSSNAEQDPAVSASSALGTPMVGVAPLPQQQPSPYYPQASMSPVPGQPQNEIRYLPSTPQFRTPQLPSSVFGSVGPNNVIRSSPRSFTSHQPPPNVTSSPIGKRQHTQHSYPNQVQMPIAMTGLDTSGIPWQGHDPFVNQSPNYSSSSGYPSPILGASAPDFGANMFAHQHYAHTSQSGRTRSPSDASYIEPNSWVYPSRSPTSATSTLAAYTWTSNDKSPAPSSMAYMATSYPMPSAPMPAGVDPMTGTGAWGTTYAPKSMAQRDEEEQTWLFPDQSYGMASIAQYPYEDYLDNYWRSFHRNFPIVHRPTTSDDTGFGGLNEGYGTENSTLRSGSPMLLAAMVAIGGQYSIDSSVRRKSRILHDRCVKLLDQRDLTVMTESERLCDLQSVFLVEVLSQYRARRAAMTLSPRFGTLYTKLHQEHRYKASNILNSLSAAIGDPTNVTYEMWQTWADMEGQQKLLLACYVLETQQAVLLARQPTRSLIADNAFDLPFPSHASLWDASSPEDWVLAAQQHSRMPVYVYEVTPNMTGTYPTGTFDAFQSSILIAAHYNHFNIPMPHLDPIVQTMSGMEHLLDSSPTTKHLLLTYKLAQVVPSRPLLAVSGESWILSEKVSSAQSFEEKKQTLRAWLGGLWAPADDGNQHAVKEALKTSIEILQHSMLTQTTDLRLELGPDMGLYFASLVIWAVTVALHSRSQMMSSSTMSVQHQGIKTTSPMASASHDTSAMTSVAVSPGHLLSAPSTTPNPRHPSTLGLTPRAPHMTPSMLPHSEISLNSISFLSSALQEIDLIHSGGPFPADVHVWQQGSSSLLMWTKMRLRNSESLYGFEPRDSVVGPTSVSTGTTPGGDGLGELLDSVLGALEKVLNGGWDGWDI